MKLKLFFFVTLCLSTAFIFVSLYPTQSEEKKSSLLFTGDMMVGRYVETLTNMHGKTYPFEKIQDTLQTSKLVIANLEGPINSSHRQTPNYTYSFSFPESIGAVLKTVGIGAVSLANNHTDDQGESIFKNTQKILHENALGYFGHPTRIDDTLLWEAHIDNRHVIFASYNTTYENFDLQHAKIQIEHQKKQNPDAFVIVSMHWGEEYKTKANTKQQNIAHTLIDGGADLIIGHHPHVVQNIEKYKNRYIFYSLGNFVFDQYFSKQVQQGLLVAISFTENGEEYKLLPIQSKKSQPELMKDTKIFLEDLAKNSDLTLKHLLKTGILTRE